jgi:hypothetical protein
MTTNNYQVNVNNVQGNVNIQINGEKTERVSSPGPEKHYSSGASSSLLDVACLIGTGLINVACLLGIGLIEGLNFSFTKVICPSLGFVAEKTTLLLGEKIETPEVLPLEPELDSRFETFENSDYLYLYLTFWKFGASSTDDIRINITDRHQYSTEIMQKLQRERYPEALYGCCLLSSKTKLVETLILEQ